MNLNHEQDIDRVLNALGHTDPPTGLEARIAGHMRTASTMRPSPFAVIRSFFAVILTLSLPKGKDPRILLAVPTRYALATAALLTLSLTAIHPRHNRTTHPVILSEVSRSTMRETQPKDPDAPHPTKTVRHLSTTTLCDCDPTALAETLAHSHPAPPMPLTPQERLLLAATRPGSPLEVAELDQLREPILRAAAEAHEHNNLRQYMQGLLSPLAAAQALETTSTPPPSDPTPAPEASDPN